jgi:hypothetical protein
MRTMTGRAIATAAAAVIALTTVSLQPAAAASRRGDAAAAAAILGIFGTVAGLIAAQQYRDDQAYAYGPVYNEGPVYGRPVYRGPAYGGPVHVPHGGSWHHEHHR